MKTKALAVLSVGLLVSALGCAGADPQQQDDAAPASGGPIGWSASSPNPSASGAPFTPPWQSHCPGPSCDPGIGIHPEWIVDPAPDYVEKHSAKNVGDPDQLDIQAKEKAQ